MCRSAAQGGRRCPGATRPSTTPGSSFTPAAATPPTDLSAATTRPGSTNAGRPSPGEATHTTPTAQRRAAFLRDNRYTGPIDTDGNATATTTRTTDGLGRPLTDKSARFFALREAGYTGPLDQDSNPSDAHTDVFAALDQSTHRAPAPDTGAVTSHRKHGDHRDHRDHGSARSSRWSINAATVNVVGGTDAVDQLIGSSQHHTTTDTPHTTNRGVPAGDTTSHDHDATYEPGSVLNVRIGDAHIGHRSAGTSIDIPKES